jgi:hypothetical protein
VVDFGFQLLNIQISYTSISLSKLQFYEYSAYKIPLSEEDRKKETAIIKSIARAKGYNPSLIEEIGMKILRRIRNQDRLRSRTILTTGQDNNEKNIAFNFTGERT